MTASRAARDEAGLATHTNNPRRTTFSTPLRRGKAARGRDGSAACRTRRARACLSGPHSKVGGGRSGPAEPACCSAAQRGTLFVACSRLQRRQSHVLPGPFSLPSLPPRTLQLALDAAARRDATRPGPEDLVQPASIAPVGSDARRPLSLSGTSPRPLVLVESPWCWVFRASCHTSTPLAASHSPSQPWRWIFPALPRSGARPPAERAFAVAAAPSPLNSFAFSFPVFDTRAEPAHGAEGSHGDG